MRTHLLAPLLAQYGVDLLYVSSPENLHYFTGFRGDNGHLLFSEGRAILLTDGRFTEQAEHETRGVSVQLIQGKLTSALAPYFQGKRVGFESDFLTVSMYARLKDACPDTIFVPCPNLAQELRAVKDADEISAIQTACEMADRAFAALLPNIRPGRTERELKCELEYLLAQNGSENPAFETIVACGVRASLPHAMPTEQSVSEHDLITFDFGAVCRGYHSDITRTVCIGAPALKGLWDTVLGVQEELVCALRPGMTCHEIDTYQRNLFAREGLDHAIVHSLGHGVGLNIHEEPRVSQNVDTVLTPNMVITIEPGLYLPKKGGVRTEDTVLITENGCKRLTKTPHYLVR